MEKLSNEFFIEIINDLIKLGNFDKSLINQIGYNIKNKLLNDKLISKEIKIDKFYQQLLENNKELEMDNNENDNLGIIKSLNIKEEKIDVIDIIDKYSRYKIDFYEIEKLGNGGFGYVYKVIHKLDHQSYAIKMVPLIFNKKNDIEKVLNEVRLLSSLNHPNIIKYYSSWLEYYYFKKDNDIIENDSLYLTLFIQMELAKSNLSEYLLEREEIDEKENERIMIQILEGLNYLNYHKIVHRDIKPSNIFIKNDLPNDYQSINPLLKHSIKIGDFGLATTIINDINNDNLTLALKKSNYFVSDIYAPPEYLENYYYHDSDLYSLGLILFELYYLHKTDTEKYINLINLKNNNIFPKNFNQSKIKNIILSLINPNYSSRIKFNDLINSSKFINKY
jgi:serine/threonine protein kinase